MPFPRCLVALLLVSCAIDEQDRYDSVRKASKASGICAIHHVPLTRTVAYEYSHYDEGTVDLDESALALWGKYPNIIDPYCEKTRSRDYHDPKVVYFCPICQRGFDDESKIWTQHSRQ